LAITILFYSNFLFYNRKYKLTLHDFRKADVCGFYFLFLSGDPEAAAFGRSPLNPALLNVLMQVAGRRMSVEL
jgi:hypothetical protein